MEVLTSRHRPSRSFLESLPRISPREERFMYEAIAEARKAQEHPYVGALLVCDGEVISTGHRHKDVERRCGLVHAEQSALERGARNARGADLYTTLEPCTYRGKGRGGERGQKPCCGLILSYGVRRVIAGGIDANYKISGRGLLYLRDRGISVCYGGEGLEKELRKLFPSFRRP